VGETIARARALAEQLDRPEYVVPRIFGQWSFHVARSEHKLALSLVEQLEKIGEGNLTTIDLRQRNKARSTYCCSSEVKEGLIEWRNLQS
jgi:hypothetical protein